MCNCVCAGNVDFAGLWGISTSFSLVARPGTNSSWIADEGFEIVEL